MAESQKEDSSSVNSKQKKSLLDLDFGKDDFLTSWKSMSITEDDTMDLDFGPVSKGKKNAFNFDKVDMDFNLDGDFGKVPSFNLDIPDIDISSPLQKNGKSKGRSNEESTSGNTHGKADRFEFTFDFGELDGFNFKLGSKKEDAEVDKGENKEDSSKRRVPQKSRDCMAEDVNAHEGGKSRNLPASGDLIASNLDSQAVSGGSPGSSNENSLSKSGTNHEGFLNSMAAIAEVASHEAMTVLEKTTSTSKKELNCQPDKSVSAEPFSHEVSIADETIQDESVHTILRDGSKRDTVLEVEEEVSPRDTRVSNKHLASFKNDNRGSEICTDNRAFVANKEGAVPALGGSHVEEILSAGASRESVSCNRMNLKNQERLELSTSPSNSRATANNLMPENERETVTRSKYFKQPETESRFENASDQTKLSSMHDRVIGTRQPCPLNESRNCNSIEAKSDNTVAGVSPSSSGSLIGKKHSHIGTQANSKCLKTNSFRINSSLSGMTKISASQNSANPASLALNVETSQTRKDRAAEGDKVSSSKAIKQVPSLSSLTIRSALQSSANPASLAINVEASHSRKDIAAEGDKASSSKATKQMPTLSGLTISRTSGANLDSSKSAPEKEITLSRDMRQHRFLAGSTPSQTAKVVETKNQTPGIPSLKRKIVEDSGADVILKPSKRLSESPINENSAETGMLVDGEACGNGNVVDGKSMSAYDNEQTYRLDVPGHINGLDILFSVESDSNIKKAEACAKGLEDICSMLRKKHDEAKEILVQAVVTNNKLLMLNHPMYEEKIRMVQKFAMQLTTRKLHTPTECA